jgi:RNA polymerase sigma-70 factor (ECF subfamily)
LGGVHRGKDHDARLRESSWASFDEAVLPHLDAAYNLARWLTRNETDAEDVVQEAFVRAFRFYGGFQGGNSRAWLLTIVRNTCCTWLQANRAGEPTVTFDEEVHSSDARDTGPEAELLANANREIIKQAIEELPWEFREVIVLREIEGMSYKDIAGIAGIPLGTVMSRLTRARERLRTCLARRLGKES